MVQVSSGRWFAGSHAVPFSTSGTTVKAADTFYLMGEATANSLTDHSGIRFGKFVLPDESEVTSMVVDSRSSRTVAMGSMYR